MYGFVDTVTGSSQSTSMSLRTIFDKINLDESLTDENGRFVTTAVGGRGILPRRINMTETPSRHGARERSQTYDVREIPVEFLIEDRTSKGLRERFERMNGILLGSKKILEFTDENAHFIATLESGDIPPENSNSFKGTLNFICTDSAKRKKTKVLNITTSTQVHEITGQASTPWTSKAVFEAPASQYTMTVNNGLNVELNYDFIAGDILRIDADRRLVTLNGYDLATSVSLDTNWLGGELQPGSFAVNASHATEIYYTERFY